MKSTETYFDKRIQKDLCITSTEYANGLLRVLQFLFCDLNDLLAKEGRRFGIVLSYLNSIYLTYKKIDLSEGLSNYNKIIFLYKPIIIKEYKKLCRKRVSEADSVIIIIKKILELINEVPSYQYNREVKTLIKIITKLFDNIRNKNKNTSLKYLMDTIRGYMETGTIGKYQLDHFSILEEEAKKIRTPLEGSGVRLEEDSSCKVSEIVWKGE